MHNTPVTPGQPPFEIVEHTADWSIRVRGETLADLFTAAAQGMAFLLAGDLSAVPQTHTKQIAIDGYGAVDLLVAWLSELAYFAERDGNVFATIVNLTVTPERVEATVCGGPPAELLKHIKAVTYHMLSITETKDGLEATIVFDV